MRALTVIVPLLAGLLLINVGHRRQLYRARGEQDPLRGPLLVATICMWACTAALIVAKAVYHL